MAVFLCETCEPQQRHHRANGNQIGSGPVTERSREKVNDFKYKTDGTEKQSCTAQERERESGRDRK